MKNLKFHAIAIAAISLIIVGLATVFDTSKPSNPHEQTPQPGDRQIHIISATWGENCNAEIARILTESPPANASGKTPPAEKPKPIARDNAMEALGKACNNKFDCTVKVNAKTLGFDPIATCFKKLVLDYRCFEIDRLNTLTVSQGETLKINCRTPKAPDASAAPKAQ